MKTQCVLIVDDNEEVRETLKQALEELGYTSDTAEDGAHGFEMVRKNDYDLILADLQMPNVDGIGLLKRVREYDTSIPVVMVTGFPSVGYAIEAMKLGATDFISKPFKLDYFELIIKRAVDERALILENTRLLEQVNRKAVIEGLNRKLHSKLGEVSNLYKISEELGSIDDNDQLFKRMVKLAGELTGAQKISLMLLDKDSNRLILREAIGLNEEIIKTIAIPVGQGIAGKVLLEKKPVWFKASDGNDYGTHNNNFTQYRSKSYISMPLIIGDEGIGVLNLTDKLSGGEFVREDLTLIATLAEKAAIKMENNALYEGIYSNLVDTLKALVSTIEAKDHYTKEHSQRVTYYAIAVARKLECSEEQIEELQFAGIIHDIGKIGISDRILQKTGRLTSEEYTIIKRHPGIGDSIVKPLGLIQSERDIIRHHHERFDGKGYPDGLGGSEIPRLARILAVADSFDAMTSKRPYREGLSVSDALRELRANSGTQFDPETVITMISCIEDGLLFAKSA